MIGRQADGVTPPVFVLCCPSCGNAVDADESDQCPRCERYLCRVCAHREHDCTTPEQRRIHAVADAD